MSWKIYVIGWTFIILFLCGCQIKKQYSDPTDLGAKMAEKGDILLHWSIKEPYENNIKIKIELYLENNENKKLCTLSVPKGDSFYILKEDLYKKEADSNGYPDKGFKFKVVGYKETESNTNEEIVSSTIYSSKPCKVDTNFTTILRYLLLKDLDPEKKFLYDSEGKVNKQKMSIAYIIHKDIQFIGNNEKDCDIFRNLTRQILNMTFKEVNEISPDVWHKLRDVWQESNNSWRLLKKEIEKKIINSKEKILESKDNKSDLPPYNAEALMVIDHRPQWLLKNGKVIPGQLCVRIYDIKRYKQFQKIDEKILKNAWNSKHKFPLLYEHYVTVNLPDSKEEYEFFEKLKV